MSSYSLILTSSIRGLQTSIQSLQSDSKVNLVNLDYPERELHKNVRPVGSCNRLVFIIVYSNNMFLWNTIIRKHKKLPDVRKQENLSKEGFLYSQYYGFGFDASIDDYKVVKLFPFKCSGSKSKRDVSYVVNIYSWKRGSWMRIPDFTGGELFEEFASGNLHWSTVNGDIVSFDAQRGVFGTLEQPNYGEGDHDFILIVSVGSIGAYCDYNDHVDVWIMKEYGIIESWTKMFTISCVHCGTIVQFILPTGEVLLDD